MARELRSVQGNEDGDVPRHVRLLLTEFKHQLRDLVSAMLNHDVGTGSKPPAVIRSIIVKSLRENQIPFLAGDYNRSVFAYGKVFDVKVHAPADHPDFLAVTIEVAASWGEDASLYIYQRQAAGWVNVLSAEETGYANALTAQSRFRYVISPPATDGSWFVVTASINPHPVSAWQQIRYKVLVPGSDADHPRILMRRQSTIYLAGHDDESLAYDLSATRTGFRVSFSGGSGPFGPADTYKYRVTAGSVTPLHDLNHDEEKL